RAGAILPPRSRRFDFATVARPASVLHRKGRRHPSHLGLFVSHDSGTPVVPNDGKADCLVATRYAPAMGRNPAPATQTCLGNIVPRCFFAADGPARDLRW